MLEKRHCSTCKRLWHHPFPSVKMSNAGALAALRPGRGVPESLPPESERSQLMSGCVLQRPTLVLNRHWQPVHVAPVHACPGHAVEPGGCRDRSRRFSALYLVGLGEARAREGEPFIRTVRFHLRVPEVLALTRHDRARHQTVTFSRRNLFKRDHSTCQYCGCQPGTEELTIDHVIPRAQGGQTTWENCALACVPLQRTQGQPNSRPGRHEASPRPGAPCLETPLRRHAASASQAGRAS